MHQVGAARDAAFRQAQSQRVWIDYAVLARRRRDILATIGERAASRVRQGGPAERARWPEIATELEELESIEADLAEASARSREAMPAVAAARWAPGRAARDEESPPSARREEELRVWRPWSALRAERAESSSGAGASAASDADPEGASEPSNWRKGRISPQGGGGIAFGGAGAPRSGTSSQGADSAPLNDEGAPPRAPTRAGNETRAEDDDDLEAYMLPEDIPPGS